MTVLPGTRTPSTPPPFAHLGAVLPNPTTYVPIPTRLVDDVRDSPRALGVYLLLGRLYQIHHQAVPLSPADLCAFDPTLTYGAARRALDRLVDSGYAVRDTQAGRKTHYRPCWGRIHDSPVPWEHGHSHVGRPRHLRILRLDDRMLDHGMGALRPHLWHPAHIRRYHATPLLTLAAIGGYVLALAGFAVPPSIAPALRDLGLLDTHGTPQPLPSPITAIPTRHSEESANPTPSDPPPVIGGVIDPMIGRVIGGVIGQDTRAEDAHSAVVRAESLSSSIDTRSHGSYGSNGLDGIHHHPVPPAAEQVGGGGQIVIMSELPIAAPEAHEAGRPDHVPRAGTAIPASTCPARPTAPHQPPTTTPTATEQQLRALGVRRAIANSLADRPEHQVRRVIDQARTRQDVRDLAGWVVSALRDLPADEPPPPPPAAPVSVQMIHANRTCPNPQKLLWVQKFHATAPHERAALIARFLARFPDDNDTPHPIL